MTQTVSEALAGSLIELRAAGVPDPVRDLWTLLSHAMKSSGHSWNPPLGAGLEEAERRVFESYVLRRKLRQPVSQIIGERWFFDHQFEVNRHVLDPRPESEILVKAAIACSPNSVLDLGTGSGCLLLSVLSRCPDAAGLGIDCCGKALAVARRNALRTGCSGRANFRRGDWLAGIAERFDVILANPPYIPEYGFSRLPPEVCDWEPRHALTPGGDGLGAYRAIAEKAGPCLQPNGRLIVEIGLDQRNP